MGDHNFVLSALATVNPCTPAPGFIDSIGSALGRTVFDKGLSSTNGSRAGWTYPRQLTVGAGSEYKAEVVLKLGADATSNSSFVTMLNASGFGYILQKSVYSIQISILTAAGIAGASTQVALQSAGITPSADLDVIRLTYNPTTGVLNGYINGVLKVTGTNNVHAADNLLPGLAIDGYWNQISIGTFTAYDVAPPATISSINDGSPITASQTTVSSVTTGFTGLPTAITSNLAGITCSAIGGTTNAPTFVKSQRVHGSPWPLNNTSATFTYVNGAETANGTQQIVKDAAEVVLTFSGAITSDPATLTYHLAADGFTPEGGELVYTPYGDLVLTADGGGTATNAGTFDSWFRPSTGTGAGNVYFYRWTITEGGISPAGGLTSSGLTISALTSAGLTRLGLQ